jgi:hypothetical protein
VHDGRYSGGPSVQNLVAVVSATSSCRVAISSIMIFDRSLRNIEFEVESNYSEEAGQPSLIMSKLQGRCLLPSPALPVLMQQGAPITSTSHDP